MRKFRFPFASALITLALVACHRNATVDPGNATMTDTNGAVTNLDTGSMASGNMSSANMAPGNGAMPTTAHASFLTDAIKGDNSEIAIGKLAQAQGGSAAVKAFGKTLETDHGAHQAKLAAMAQADGMTVPAGPSDEGQKNIDKLKGLKGAAFDTAFKAAMVEDHEKDIAKYEKQTSASDPKIAAMAKETLPTLRKHLAAAKAL